ncbi:hypothetical protein BG015_010716 [Linnemannia schmuckeri]|uniref:Retrotransposon gag domain-containing protein n=1 Tax=Linnemannia schmuckeri TaxID=64567 RepID=A0A9P5RX58_9FUNG|nr:hypothetical protein BG015_010716 [Linnemannia schmuckeri]
MAHTLITTNSGDSNSNSNSSSSINRNNSSYKSNRMHPYLEYIYRDMNRTYKALQAQIHRSRMQTANSTINKTQLTTHKINHTPATTTTKESMTQFSSVVESLLNQFTDYQTIQANIFQQQLAATLTNNNTVIPTISYPPLSPLCPPSDRIHDPARTHATARVMDLGHTKNSRTSHPSVTVGTETSSFLADIRPTASDRYSINKGTDTDMVTSSQFNSTLIKQELVSSRMNTTTDDATHTPWPSLRSSNTNTLGPSGSYYHALISAYKQLSLTRKQCRDSSSSTSTSSHSCQDHYNSPSTSTSCTSAELTHDQNTPSSYSPSSPARSLIRLKPLPRKFNADNAFTLSDYVRQLEEMFNRNPALFKKDSSRVQYALRSMSQYVLRFFEPFLNKSIPDNRNCLTRYYAFLEILEEKFEKSPSHEAKLAAKDQLLTIKQTGTMHSYITTIRDLSTIVRRSESSLINIFKKGISPEVKAFLVNPNQIKSLSDLQVASVKAYSTYRNLPLQKQQQSAKAAYPSRLMMVSVPVLCRSNNNVRSRCVSGQRSLPSP